MVNQVIAEILEGKYDGYILNSHYFDFDVVLYECLSEKRKLSFLSRVSKCRTFQVLDADAQSILNDYAMKDIKDSIRKGTYINQPDYLKD